MITGLKIDLTDAELKMISGKARPATRKQVKEFVSRLIAVSLQRGESALPIITPPGSPGVGHPSLSCTSLDHLWPLGPKTDDTPCYCGQKVWNDPKYRENIEAGRPVLSR